MKVIRKSDLVSGIVDAWKNQYYNGYKWRSERFRNTWLRLKQAEVLTEDSIAEIIGNDAWTQCLCNECGADCDVVVEVGERSRPFFDSKTAYLCENCLLNALQVAREG